MKCLNEAVELLAQDEVLREHFSRGKFTSEIHDLLAGLLDVPTKDIEKVTASAVTSLIDKLEKTPMLRWRVLIPITNLVLNLASLEIARVSFAQFDKSKSDETLTTLRKMNEKGTSPQPVKQEAMKLVTDLISQRYSNHVVATVKVEAGDQGQAVALAENEIERALNVLRFYSRVRNDARLRKMFVGPEGTIFRGTFTTLCFAGEEAFFLAWRNTGYLFDHEIDSNGLSLMNKLSFQRVCGILQKPEKERTDFERLLLTAIDFYGWAMNEPNARTAYVSFMISLESLLLKEGEPRGLLRERVAIIVGENAEARESLFHQMRNCYHVRSQIVHHGFDDVTEDDVWLISIIGFRVIATLLPVSERINDIGQLIDMCTRSKFSGPIFGK